LATPTLGVMAIYWNGRRFEEIDYFRKLALKGRKLGLKVMVFSPEDVDHESRKIRGLYYNPRKGGWYRLWSPFPDVVYDRCRNQSRPRFQQLREFRARYPEVTFLNRPLSDKWGVYQTLSREDRIRPHLPLTKIFSSFPDLFRLLNQMPVLFLKPVKGTGGRGILRIEKQGENRFSVQGRDLHRRIIAPRILTERQIEARLGSWGMKDNYLVQQGLSLALEDGRVHDFRVLMQKNENGDWELAGCAGRIGAKRSVTSNLHGGGRAVPTDLLLSRRFRDKEKIGEIRRAIERLARDTVVCLEREYGSLCELGLDIAVDALGEVWLLEINPKPSREVFRRIGETRVYDMAVTRPLLYALCVYRREKAAGAGAQAN